MKRNGKGIVLQHHGRIVKVMDGQSRILFSFPSHHIHVFIEGTKKEALVKAHVVSGLASSSHKKSYQG